MKLKSIAFLKKWLTIRRNWYIVTRLCVGRRGSIYGRDW